MISCLNFRKHQIYLYLQKEILKKIGCNVGHPNFLYNLVKSLLERVAPVMIDAVAIEKLVKHIDQVLNGQSEVMNGVENAGEKSVELIFVSSICHPPHSQTTVKIKKKPSNNISS